MEENSLLSTESNTEIKYVEQLTPQEKLCRLMYIFKRITIDQMKANVKKGLVRPEVYKFITRYEYVEEPTI